MNKKIYSLALTPEEADLLYGILSKGNYIPVEVPHTRIAVKRPDLGVNLYKSNKVLVQGAGTEDFVKFVLEAEVTRKPLYGNEEAAFKESAYPHMGTDESGKGDYFGPLVVVAAYTDGKLAPKMAELGAKDCKALSDKQVFSIGKSLREFLGPGRFSSVAIGPKKYNELMKKGGNLNSLLAWAHATAIESLQKKLPLCDRALSDKFADDRLIAGNLKRKNVSINLEQRHKAESDIAVAAASVIAREIFLGWLEKTSSERGVKLPKGASCQVIEAGKLFVSKFGEDCLCEVAKLHFKTTDSVLGGTLL